MHQHATGPGINEDVLLQYAKKYDAHKKDQTKRTPVGEGVLIWDEVKVNKKYSIYSQFAYDFRFSRE